MPVPKWQNQVIEFVSRGLDLVHPVDDAPAGAFVRLENTTVVQEGAIQTRSGVGKLLAAANSGTGGINSLAQFEDAVASTNAVISGAGTSVYADNTLLFNTTSTGPKTFAFFRPELYSGTVGYVADPTAMNKFWYSGGSYSSAAMGIQPPLHMLPPPLVASSTPTNIDAMQGTPTTWSATGAATVAASGVTDTINASKPTRTAVAGSITNTVEMSFAAPSASKRGQISQVIASPPLNLQQGFNDDSRIELFIRPDDPKNIKEIRLIFSLETGTYTKNYYIHTIRGADLAQAVSAGVNTVIPARREATESRLATEETRSPESQFINPTLSRLDDPTPPEDYGAAQIVLGVNQWQAFSIERRRFLRVGSDETLDWSNVQAVQFEVLTSEAAPAGSATVIRFYQLDIVATSALDSTEGIPYDYRAAYWNATMGITSNPSPPQAQGVNIIRRSSRLEAPASADSQVTHLDLYRRGGLLGDYHRLVRLSVATDMTTKTVTGASNPASPAPIVITVASTAGLQNGDWVLIQSVGGNTAANGLWQISGLSATTFVLMGSLGNGAYTSGGTVKYFLYTDLLSDESIALNPIIRVDCDQPITSIQTRTNLLKYSEDFSNAAWVTSLGTVYSDDANGPFGTQNADLLRCTGIFNSITTIYQDVTGGSAQRTFSIYMKRSKGTGRVDILLFDGTLSGSALQVNISNFPDKHWQRFEFTTTCANPRVEVIVTNSGSAASGDEIWLWGAQLEVRTYPTDYIQTVADAQSVTDATRLATPVHTIFGPFLGKWIFGLGDQYRPNVLYWSNAQDPDSWSPANSLEVSDPGEPLQAGFIYEGRAFVFTKNRLFVIYPALTGLATFTALETSCNVGLWLRRAFTIGPKVWFVGRNGIYETTGGDPYNLTEDSWVRPLFNDTAVNGYNAVNFNVLSSQMQLVWYDPYLLCIYRDLTTLRQRILRYHTGLKRWEFWSFPSTIEIQVGLWRGHGFDRPNDLIFGTADGWTYKLTGTTDIHGDGTVNALGMTVRTPSFDQGSSRQTKLYGDLALEADLGGAGMTVQVFLNDESTTGGVFSIASSSGRQWYVIPINTLTLGTAAGTGTGGTMLGRSLSVEVIGGNSAKLYNLDIAFLPQEDQTKLRPLDWDDLGKAHKKYVWGCSLDCDTLDQAKSLGIYADGLQKSVQSIPVPINTTITALGPEATWTKQYEYLFTAGFAFLDQDADWDNVFNTVTYYRTPLLQPGAMFEGQITTGPVAFTTGVTTYNFQKVSTRLKFTQMNFLGTTPPGDTAIQHMLVAMGVTAQGFQGFTRIGTSLAYLDGTSTIKGRLQFSGEDNTSPANYSAGTAAVTNGSVTVVGTGTTWTAAMVGRQFKLDAVATIYTIAAFTDATHINLSTAWTGTTQSGTYVISGSTLVTRLVDFNLTEKVVLNQEYDLDIERIVKGATATYRCSVYRVSGATRYRIGIYEESYLAAAGTTFPGTGADAGKNGKFPTFATSSNLIGMAFVPQLRMVFTNFSVHSGVLPSTSTSRVTPASMTNIVEGVGLEVNAGGAADENVVAISVDPVSFLTAFANTHVAGEAIIATSGQHIRRRVEFSWPVFQANLLRLWPQDSVTWALYDRTWYFADEVPQLKEWHTYWQAPVDGGDVYVWGCELEGDTSNVAKSVIFERDGGVLISTQNVTLNGHDKARVTFEQAVRAHTLRVRSTDGTTGFLYKVNWLYLEEPPLIAEWDSIYQGAGDLTDMWISGIELECDTQGVAKILDIFADGVFAQNVTVSTESRGVARAAFTQPLRASSLRFVAADNVIGRLYRWKWITEAEPPLLANWATNYDNLGSLEEKYITGVYIDADTLGVNKTVPIEIDGSAITTLTINHNGRRNNIYTWAVVKGREARIAPSDTNPGRLYGYKFIWSPEPPLVPVWDSNWQALVAGQDVYCWGLEVECDTANAAKSLVVVRNGGTAVSTQNVTANGRSKQRITWSPVKAGTLRFSSTTVNGRLYGWTWLFYPEPPALLKWDTNYETDGSLEDKFISGVYIEADTAGGTTSVQIEVDGAAVGAPISFSTTNPHQPIKLTFGPTRGVTMRFYTPDSNAVAWRLYAWKWIWEIEPVELKNFATNWENLGHPYEVYVKGVAIEADTFGVLKAMAIRTNGDDTTNVATFSITGTGRDKIQVPFANVLARTIRLAPTDTVTGRLYSHHWIVDDEPPFLTTVQTQEQSLDATAWMHVREAWIGIRSTTSVTFTVTIDGTAHAYTIASTAGARQKVRVPMDPVKGKIYKFHLTAASAFKVYPEDAFIYMRKWNSQLDYELRRLPFEGGLE